MGATGPAPSCSSTSVGIPPGIPHGATDTRQAGAKIRGGGDKDRSGHPDAETNRRLRQEEGGFGPQAKAPWHHDVLPICPLLQERSLLTLSGFSRPRWRWTRRQSCTDKDLGTESRSCSGWNCRRSSPPWCSSLGTNSHPKNAPALVASQRFLKR